MSSYQKQYAEILTRLIDNPVKQTNSRIGKVHSNFVEIMRVNLEKEFPLMDLKKIQFSNILHELLWFIKGDTHIKYLINNGCNIWTDDAYRYYKEKIDKYNNEMCIQKIVVLSKEEFIERAKNSEEIIMGDLGRIYGKQWREFNGKTDQLQNCINSLKTNPDDRRMIVSAHNPTDLEDGIVGLPSCHNMFQFYTIPLTRDERIHYYHYSDKYQVISVNDSDKILDSLNVPKYKLNLWFNIRSNDFFLGQPYNMASYALLVNIVANIVNMIPNEIVCTAIDCHLYEAHLIAAKEYLRRWNELIRNYNISGENDGFYDIGYCKSQLWIKRKLDNVDDIQASDFELVNYNPQSYIKAQLLT